MSSDEEGVGSKNVRDKEPGLHHIRNRYDEEELEEEDLEDDMRVQNPRKRSKFIDDEAGEGEPDEDDDEAEDDRDEADEAERMGPAIAWQRREGLSWLENVTTEEDMRRRYHRVDDDDDDGNEDDDLKNARLPDAVKDPKVWCVKVKNGTERQVVLQLMNKFIALGKQDHPLHITSAYCNEEIPGFVYVEAMREGFVKEALGGLCGVYYSKMTLVPVQEMSDTVKVLHKDQAALEGMWARCRHGKYKGDIAYIMKYDLNRNEVHVKLVPRVDQTDYGSDEETASRKRKEAQQRNRPPKRLFAPSSYSDLDLERWGITSERDHHDYSMSIYFYEGFQFEGSFLTKFMPVKSVVVGPDLLPELDELKMFEQGQGVTDMFIPYVSSMHKRRIVLQKGDTVRVKGGELIGLLGKVDSIRGETVTMVPQHDAFKQKVEFSVEELEKYFELGDQVKVVGGRKVGITGTVVNFHGDKLSVLTDVSKEEIVVFSSQLQDTHDTSSGIDVVGGFQLYDLVLLEAATSAMTMPSVGVIIKLDRDALQVLDNHGKIRAVRPADAQMQRKSATAVALDSEQQTVGQGDVVKVSDGQMKGKTGTVRHVFRAFLFIYSPLRMENAGMSVVRSRQCNLVGQSKHVENMSPQAAKPLALNPLAPRHLHPAHTSGPGGQGWGKGRRGGWESKRIKITKGFDKGKIGTVKEETEHILRVELDATHKKINVKKTDVEDFVTARFNLGIGGVPTREPHPGMDTLYPRAERRKWCVKGIQVRAVSGEYRDRPGVVVDLLGSDCRVDFQEQGVNVTMAVEDLEAVPPGKNSSVMILQGELKGSTGKLIGIDGQDGIVKMDLNADIKIVDMPSLAVYINPAH